MSKFLIFGLPNVSGEDALSIRRGLHRGAINGRGKELQCLSEELSLSVDFLSTQRSTVDFYVLTNSIASCNRRSLRRSLCIERKSCLH